MFENFEKESHIYIAEFLNYSRNVDIKIWEHMNLRISKGTLSNIAIVHIWDIFINKSDSYVIYIEDYYNFIIIKERRLKINKIKNSIKYY